MLLTRNFKCIIDELWTCLIGLSISIITSESVCNQVMTCPYCFSTNFFKLFKMILRKAYSSDVNCFTLFYLMLLKHLTKLFVQTGLNMILCIEFESGRVCYFLSRYSRLFTIKLLILTPSAGTVLLCSISGTTIGILWK